VRLRVRARLTRGDVGFDERHDTARPHPATDSRENRHRVTLVHQYESPDHRVHCSGGRPALQFAGDEADLQHPGRAGPGLGRIECLWGSVHTLHRSGRANLLAGEQRHVAAAAPDVDDARAGTDAGARQQPASHRLVNTRLKREPIDLAPVVTADVAGWAGAGIARRVAHSVNSHVSNTRSFPKRRSGAPRSTIR